MATILHAIAGYFVLLLTVRALSRRAGSQMTLFEFVLILLIGGVIILSTVGQDRSVTNCTCAVIAVGFIHRTLSWAKSRSPRIGRILDGTPLVIIKQGQWQKEVAEGALVRQDDVEIAARQAGLRRMADIDYAVLERNRRPHGRTFPPSSAARIPRSPPRRGDRVRHSPAPRSSAAYLTVSEIFPLETAPSPSPSSIPPVPCSAASARPSCSAN